MAIMHPIDIQNYKYTYSEFKFYNELKNQLSDKYHVFYSVRWFETSNEKRIDSECDFLIFDPGFGFLTIEVKGGLSITIENGNWMMEKKDEDGSTHIRQLKCSPFMQAEKSMRHFYNYFSEEFLQTFNGVYGFAVAFPLYAINDTISVESTKELIIDINSMNNLGKKINEIFHYWQNKRKTKAPFSAEQKQRFISMVNKQISLSAAAGALIPIKEKEFEKINLVQDSLIDFLYNYKQVQIVGGAGTGKTFIAIKKLIREALSGAKCMYLCMSRPLAKFVEEQIPSELDIKCCNFDDLMKDILKIDFKECGEISYFDLLSKKEKFDRYDLIVVDEAQDFDVDKGLSIRHMLRNEGESMFYVFLDKNQNIFDANFDSAFALDYPPYVLRYNIRNTGAIYQYAIDNTGIGGETIVNSLVGVEPEKHDFKNKSQALASLTNIINRLIQKECVKISSIVILSDEDYSKSILKNENKVGAYDISYDLIESTEENKIKFRTISEYKGLEADIIIYLNHIYKEKLPTISSKYNDYVGITRARYYLYVLKILCTLEI